MSGVYDFEEKSQQSNFCLMMFECDLNGLLAVRRHLHDTEKDSGLMFLSYLLRSQYFKDSHPQQPGR